MKKNKLLTNIIDNQKTANGLYYYHNYGIITKLKDECEPPDGPRLLAKENLNNKMQRVT